MPDNFTCVASRAWTVLKLRLVLGKNKYERMKKFFKGLVLVVALLIAVAVALFVLYDEPLPTGKEGPDADALARRMIASVNGDAWQQTGAVSWTFRGPHYHLWDKQRHLAKVAWEGHVVLLDIDKRIGFIQSDTEGLSTLDKAELCETAWKCWVNDAFWLNPVTKAFDGGTRRSIVPLEDGKEGLMVSYTSGGATPGDAYLWLLDEDFRPAAWKMWVSIIPVGGVEFTWEDWIKTETGAWIATSHEGLISVPIKEVRTASTLNELTGGDIFEPLLNPQNDLIEY